MIKGSAHIKGLIKAYWLPNKPELVNPASFNLTLGNTFLIPKFKPFGYKLGDEIEYKQVFVKDGETFWIMPKQFILAAVREYIVLPNDVAAYVHGRSSIGRAGISVQNAGFADPGFVGEITLEIKNENWFPVGLVPGYEVAQCVFEEAAGVERGYSGKYWGQTGATGSLMHEDVRKGSRKDDERSDSEGSA